MRKILFLVLLASVVPLSGQTPAPVPIPTYFNTSGNPCSGCLLYTYAAGTSTPLATYRDTALTTAHTNPIVLSTIGRPPTVIFLAATSYKFILRTPGGATIWTADSISAVPSQITGVSSAGDLELRVDTDNNGSHVFSFLNGDTVQKAALDESGNLQLDGRLSPGSGIGFPEGQTASADPNVLDDYEEGDWIPTIGGAGGTSGQTYTTRVGRYVKVGKRVSADFNVLLSAKGTITGALQIQGLPFTVDSSTGYAGSVVISYWVGMAANYAHVGGYTNPGEFSVMVTGMPAAGAVSHAALATADVTNTTQLVGTITYLANN